ncbi:ACP S-malonyltransferase [Egicoccus halophilus]|uniref:Malonyl CoA-acyl carrier protein transacylase n=1 Tax=Egicoccus halophilus TaxID=1670830 RepID=A0A8J3EU22_9ACTN|nr:acyltransferase domain-containing protein [Egicoccus halophilus]GGI06250.1 malonyl CoA-acyl carrier protein transacylase [Egicoccus halophilus]
MRLAFVFPGQGSHRAGSLDAWAGHPAAAVVDTVADAIDRDVWALAADAGTGARTADAQPTILTASLVAWRALLDGGVAPDVVAGHSLGEVTAAIAAGVVPVADGARVVAARGAAMGRACAANPGSMAALVKLQPDAVQVLVDEDPDLVVANDNAPGQVVLAGTPEAVERIRSRAREAGGRALPLDVEGAFHSPAMAPAVDDLREALAALRPADPRVPLVTGTSAEVLHEAQAVVDALVDGVLAPVRWREVQGRLAELGVTDLVEVGPGGVLAGLAKRTVPDLQVHAAATPDDVADVVERFAGVRA